MFIATTRAVLNYNSVIEEENEEETLVYEREVNLYRIYKLIQTIVFCVSTLTHMIMNHQ